MTENRQPISPPALSIVVASYNNWDYMRGCLTSVPAAGVSDPEIIVVDNCSTDGTADRIAATFPAVRLVRNAANEGHCRAMNQGIALATGEFVLALDGDTVLAPGSASVLLDFLRARPGVAIAAPRMLNPDGTVQQTARTFPSPLNGLFGRQSALTRLLPNNPISARYLRSDTLDTNEPFRVDWVSAAAMMFRRSLTDRIGYWDEEIKGYWVDADWCKSAHAAGEVYCVPGSIVTHFEQNRWGRKKGAARIILFHTGAFRFYTKHFTAGFLDPRALIAGAALACRAALLLLIDSFRRPDAASPKARSTSCPNTQSMAAGEE